MQIQYFLKSSIVTLVFKHKFMFLYIKVCFLKNGSKFGCNYLIQSLEIPIFRNNDVSDFFLFFEKEDFFLRFFVRSSAKTVKNCFLCYSDQVIAFYTIVRLISKQSSIKQTSAIITQFPKMIFYIPIYLIIKVLLNDAIIFCLKITVSSDSCRT